MNIFQNKKKIDSEDYYYNKKGFIVFTKKYHLKRGYCCYNNCKHCPYKRENMINIRKCILQGIPSKLPDKKEYDHNISHAPKRKEILNKEEK